MESSIKIEGVRCIQDPAMGRVYRGEISIAKIAKAVEKGTLKYSPKYQRGYQKKYAGTDRFSESDYDQLLALNVPDLQIDRRRAEEIGTKYIMGCLGIEGKALRSVDLIWNARAEEGEPPPEYDAKTGKLEIFTEVTVPDSAHRHYGLYLVHHWKMHPEEIPSSVIVDGVPVENEDIEGWLREIDLTDTSRHSRFVTIYNVDAVDEGLIYDEFNSDAKPPSQAKQIKLNPRKTPDRRFVHALMAVSPIFSSDEVEQEVNSIGSKSRKLTTNSTLVSAVRPFVRPRASLATSLVDLERRDDQADYDDLVSFVSAFFAEWAQHIPAYQPGTNYIDRHKARGDSFALSNIMFFPLISIGFKLWMRYQGSGQDWRGDQGWKRGLGKLAGKVSTRDDEGNPWTGGLMSRGNPDWVGRIQIKKTKPDGSTATSLMNTRQSRESAEEYLIQKSGLGSWIA